MMLAYFSIVIGEKENTTLISHWMWSSVFFYCITRMPCLLPSYINHRNWRSLKRLTVFSQWEGWVGLFGTGWLLPNWIVRSPARTSHNCSSCSFIFHKDMSFQKVTAQGPGFRALGFHFSYKNPKFRKRQSCIAGKFHRRFGLLYKPRIRFYTASPCTSYLTGVPSELTPQQSLIIRALTREFCIRFRPTLSVAHTTSARAIWLWHHCFKGPIKHEFCSKCPENFRPFWLSD
jgi:hypothetical protein